MCAKKVRSSLQNVGGLTDLTLQLSPAVAHFDFDPAKESIQDLIRTVRAAGREYDARLMLQSTADDDKLTAALQSVSGVRSPGSADKRGIRLITFLMDKKTMYADIDAAANSINAQIAAPTFKEKEKPGS
jgi:copper chaperone CopZ